MQVDYKKISLLDVHINTFNEAEVLSKISDFLDDPKSKKMIFTPNPEMIVESRKDIDFLNILNKSDLNLPDGTGLFFASTFLALPLRFKSLAKLKIAYSLFQASYVFLFLLFLPFLTRRIIPEKICGSDIFWKICQLCSDKKKRIFLLGAGPGVAEKVRERVLLVYPKLQIAGTYSGSADPFMDKEIRHLIDMSEADFLFVAFGAPKQEKWIDRNLAELKTVKVAMGVGGTFDFVSGKVKRAPLLLRKLGLEWLFRLFLMPTRFFRIYNAVFRFTKLVIEEKLKIND